MSKQSFLQGAALLTITMFLSKILGFIYVIPFTKLVGTQGYILFEYAYKPYAIMLSLATMGLPSAVSKFISKYNALGDYETGRRLFKSGIIILTATGVLFTSILYIGAPQIAEWYVGKEQTTGNSMEDVTYVIRMVSFALLIVPPMALGRGFFQGFQKMSPTGVSQVVEQLVRIIMILVVSFIVMYYGSGEMRTAVGWSTFAAFVGAIFSVFTLVYYWMKYKKEIIKPNTKTNSKKPSLWAMYKELVLSSVPFVIVSLAIPLYQNIDIFSINPVLQAQGKTLAEAEYVNSIVSLVQKIAVIPIVFANAFALTLVPSITKAFIENNKKDLDEQITKSFEIIFFLTLPCFIFFFVFAKETFGILLGTEQSQYGGEVTMAYASISIFISFFLVTAAILQGINKQKFAVVSLLIGSAVKLALSIPFIQIFSGSGTAYSSIIGYTISILLNFYVIKKYTQFNYKKLVKKSSYVVGLSIITGVVLWIIKHISITLIPHSMSNYMNDLIIVAVGVVVIGIVYLGISYLTGLLGYYLGNRFKRKVKA
ncbi:polysaccharide biosynthesis protein [Priestia filamentosa]|uniref:putative polysaccharide biosynthesis protein n=1 Tax=Priestia filamentosa TaxID=1402861 RepID=UPI00397999AB